MAVFAVVVWLASCPVLQAAEPAVLEWIPGLEAVVKLPEWVNEVRIDRGSIADGVWRVGADATVGEGRIDLLLSGVQRPHALALTIALGDDEVSDLAIQLYNREGSLVAVDLFGNIAESARAGRTDTFIVPLAAYPTATWVSIRRISGNAEIGGIVAFPVVTALDELPEGERVAFARMLGETLENSISGTGNALTRIRTVDNDATLERLLADPDYPEVVFSAALPESQMFQAHVSGTCYRFFTTLYLELFNSRGASDGLYFVSSNTALQAVLSGRNPVALSSYPPSAQELADYEARNGHPLLVVPVGRDAVEVLVHPRNSNDAMDFPTLRRIFSDDVQSKEGPLFWDADSGLRGPILVAGGVPEWGTSRFFADKVLGGDKLDSRMIELDVAFPRGVERFVSENTNAIGFAQHSRREYDVKVLAVGADKSSATVANAETVASGAYPLTRHLYLVLGFESPAAIPEPVREIASRLLSRDGQRAVAKAGSFALNAEEARASRRLLGLD